MLVETTHPTQVEYYISLVLRPFTLRMRTARRCSVENF